MSMTHDGADGAGEGVRESSEEVGQAQPAQRATEASTALPILGQEASAVSGVPMNRRAALKVMAIVAAAPGMANCAPGETASDPTAVPAPTSNPMAAGTAWDPDLVAPTVSWQRVLAADELEGVAALCDVIIPADERSPSASAVGAHEFIDEWVSAPYEGNGRDLVMIRGGLAWLDRESASRFGNGLRFRDLAPEQQTAICDDIAYQPDAAPGFGAAARFFDRFRDLTSTAFWTTQPGMDDLGYIGNVPLAQWDPPPPEVLRHLGLE